MRMQVVIVVATLCAGILAQAPAGGKPAVTGKRPGKGASAAPAGGAKIWAVVFDFSGGKRGAVLAEKVRGRLRRHKEYGVVDHLTTREFSGPVGLTAGLSRVRELTQALACTVALHGTVRGSGAGVQVDVKCVDLRNPAEPGGWTAAFSDATERGLVVTAMRIVEKLRGEAEWVPPQYGDEAEPKKFGKPLNVNGDFERGHRGWDPPDRVSTFLVRGPKGRGKILRVRTDLARDPWLEYRRQLRMGRTTPARAPHIARDTSYGSVAGLEGVHYRGMHIDATALQRYWMPADHNGQGGAKVFVKGFRDWSAEADGLPESSLAALGLTPEQFARLSAKRQKALIVADTKRRPQVHRRECYRWYLNCKDARRQWKHLAAPFPPRGGLAKNVQWLQVQVYSYWPPGEYLWDNVWLHKAPRQKGPAPEEKARTPNFDKR